MRNGGPSSFLSRLCGSPLTLAFFRHRVALSFIRRVPTSSTFLTSYIFGIFTSLRLFPTFHLLGLLSSRRWCDRERRVAERHRKERVFDRGATPPPPSLPFGDPDRAPVGGTIGRRTFGTGICLGLGGIPFGFFCMGSSPLPTPIGRPHGAARSGPIGIGAGGLDEEDGFDREGPFLSFW